VASLDVTQLLAHQEMNSSWCISLPRMRLAPLDYALIGGKIEKSFGFHDMSCFQPEDPHKLVSIGLSRSRRGGSTEADDHAITIADHEMNTGDKRRCQPTYQWSGRTFREVAQSDICARGRTRSVNCPDDILGEQALEHIASGAPPCKGRLNALQIAALFPTL
jgi:hypothetical protein